MNSDSNKNKKNRARKSTNKDSDSVRSKGTGKTKNNSKNPMNSEITESKSRGAPESDRLHSKYEENIGLASSSGRLIATSPAEAGFLQSALMDFNITHRPPELHKQLAATSQIGGKGKLLVNSKYFYILEFMDDMI